MAAGALPAARRLLSVCPPSRKTRTPSIRVASPRHSRRRRSAFEVELDILKILYKQFDRTVLLHLDEIYAPANQRLKDAGLLPSLTPLARRGARKQAAAPATPPAAGAAGATVTGAAGADAGVAAPASPRRRAGGDRDRHGVHRHTRQRPGNA
ncbi:MAG: DUF1631 family protein [Gammaproteobacteria bacterium]|nr:DUF1631 family protein [Gammaproteobacteria bacterium]